MNTRPLPTPLHELHDAVRMLQHNAINTNTAIAEMKQQLVEIRQRLPNVEGFVYIASPFTHAERRVQEDRYKKVLHYTRHLLTERVWCYSPIVHCFEMARLYDMPTDAGYWMDYNYTMLTAASRLHVLCLEGWDKSVGVQAEMSFWKHARGGEVTLVA